MKVSGWLCYPRRLNDRSLFRTQASERANVTVTTAHVPRPAAALQAAAAESDIGDCVIVATSNSSVALSLVVTAQAFWGAAANISAVAGNGTAITMTSGDLGTITVSVSGGTLSTPGARVGDVGSSEQAWGAAPPKQIEAKFGAAGVPLVVSLSFSGKRYTATEANAAIEAQRAKTDAMLAAGSRAAGGLSEAYEAMATVIAWNVNWDP